MSTLVTIHDDGRGMSDGDLEKAASLGLVGMRERVWNLQGDIVGAGDDRRHPHRHRAADSPAPVVTLPHVILLTYVFDKIPFVLRPL